ncbi:MAG: trypsin-like peptidase domain-containing protein [Nitrospirae bacterium]|nr:trypsin-like peptidase domain-containing protein [Nitrospirota bacterium]
MKALRVILISIFLISGCATANRVYTPDGQTGYSINCSGSALNWGMCYEKAGELCGSIGYDVIVRSGDQGSSVVANQFGLYGGSIMNRSMMIKCKGTTPSLVVDNKPNEKSEVSFGTAWISEYGYIVTNYHVIDKSKKIRLIKSDGKNIEAYIFRRDSANDIALLRVDDISKLPPGLSISNKSSLLGSKVFTIGFPHPDMLGTSPKLNDGIISGLSGWQDDPRTYQISVPVQAGNSGGPLLNENGEVVGIVSYKIDALAVFRWTGDLPENVNYAVKSTYIDALFSGIPEKIKHDVIEPVAKPTEIQEIGRLVTDSILLVVAE